MKDTIKNGQIYFIFLQTNNDATGKPLYQNTEIQFHELNEHSISKF